MKNETGKHLSANSIMIASTGAVIAGIYGAFYHVRLLSDKNIPEEYRAFALQDTGFGLTFLAKPRGKLRLDAKDKNTGYNVIPQMLLAIGDYVNVEFSAMRSETEKVLAITGVQERKNSMHRAAFARNQCIAANLDHVLILASFDEPAYNPGFVERVLAEAIIACIDVAIILNKADLEKGLSPEILRNIEERVSYYAAQGISIFKEQLKKSVSSRLENYLDNSRSLMVGLSGTGKSTLLNQVSGKSLQLTGHVSEIKKGKHTTTNPISYVCKNNIELIDIPGLREYGMQHRTLSQIKGAFPEFYNYPCRFENCSHTNEPGCNVKEAVEDGEIPQFRYKSFLSLTTGMAERYKPRKGDFWRGTRK